MDIGYSGTARTGGKMMFRLLKIFTLLVLTSASLLADPPEEAPPDSEEVTELKGDGIERPKAMSGMSILGNEEAPKSLVIIPWKSSELGDDISLTDTLDDRAQPVDKEVFLRELSFYEIRSGE
jgi:hypothetical protein